MCNSTYFKSAPLVTEGTNTNSSFRKLQYKLQAATVQAQILTSPSPTLESWLHPAPQHATITAAECYKACPVSTLTGKNCAHGSPAKDLSSCICNITKPGTFSRSAGKKPSPSQRTTAAALTCSPATAEQTENLLHHMDSTSCSCPRYRLCTSSESQYSKDILS